MLWDMMKRQRHDIGIGPQLATAFLAVALLTLSSGIVGLLSFWQASNAAQVLVDDAEMIRAVQEIRTAVGSLSGPPSDFIITGDPAAAGRYAAAQNQVAASIEAYESGHQFHSHSAEHSRSAETLITSTRADMAILAQLGEAIFASTDRQQAVSLSSEMEALLTAANLRLNELLINAEEDIQLARQAHASAQRSAYIGLIVTALLAFGLAIGLALVFTRSISRPLAELADAADRITAGDLSTPVLVQGSGEVGQLAEAFERMRLTIIQERGQLRLLAVLEERDRIGREMHDGLAQVLGYVNTKAQAAQEFLKAGDDKAAERQLQELVGAAREAYTDAREVIVGLRMNGVPERGLAELADEYVERFRRQSGVAAELVVASSWWADALPAKVKVQALRIIQEALTNARKHARASRVVVSLETENDTAVISVEDDGCGFMLSRLLRPDFSRYGLRTMRERAQAVGGSLRIESAPGKGTSIIAILPLSEAAGVPV
jgi:signal transduction histidine kinase